jgi:hypothetical protein
MAVILANRSTLSVYSHERTVSEISAALGLEPSSSADVGDPTRAAVAGRALAPEYMIHQRAQWSFDVGASTLDVRDDQGVASLRALVDVFRQRANALQSLRPECETVIWWSGSSDSTQGTFVIPPDLLADLALLGCEFRGTAYLNDELDIERGPIPAERAWTKRLSIQGGSDGSHPS